ncbi:hypothetical protein HY256_08165 [Candidatus Sumerlaeota bacterium]|nr:hypothetical protein [Candidatus Sumerlaeota bacterium]
MPNFKIFLTFLALPLIHGCAFQAKFTYPLDPPIRVANENPPDVRLTVLPPQDARPQNNRYFPIYIFPLVLWGPIQNQRPENPAAFPTVSRFEFSLKRDIPEAIARHLQSAGIAKWAAAGKRESNPDADYFVETEVKSTQYRGKVMTYGLSIFAFPLYFIGAPAWRSDVDLELTLRLKDRAGQEIWSAPVRGTWGLWTGYYYNSGRDMD